MGIQVPRENEERQPESFGYLRCIVAMVTGGLGLVLGAGLGLFGGTVLDKILRDPMGSSGGFLSFGNLTVVCTVLGTPLGTVLGARGGHALLSGRGSFWAGLGALLVGLVPVLLVSLSVRGLVFPLLGLVPVAVAVGLELSNMFRQ